MQVCILLIYPLFVCCYDFIRSLTHSHVRSLCYIFWYWETVHAIVEGLFRRYIKQGMTPEQAFINSSESITGPITKQISKQGIKKVIQRCVDG